MNSAREAIDSLEANRAVMRGLLLPHPPGGGDPQVFPRSAVMRFMLDGRRRRLAYGLFTAAWMFMARRRRRHWLQ